MSVKKWIVRLALALVAPLAFVGVLEIVVVLVGFDYPADASPIALPLPEGEVDGRSLHARDAYELWKPVPGALVPWGRDAINAAGFRGPELAREKTPGVLRDRDARRASSTFGYGVRCEECWTAQLAQRLAERGVPAEASTQTWRLDRAPGIGALCARRARVPSRRRRRGVRRDERARRVDAAVRRRAHRQPAFETHAWGRFTERLRAVLARARRGTVDRRGRGGRSEIQRRARERRSWIGPT